MTPRPESGAALIGALLLSACGMNIDNLSNTGFGGGGGGGLAGVTCGQLVPRAVELSQSQPVRFRAIDNVRETSRTDAEVQCEGAARLTDGTSAPIYLRAYVQGTDIRFEYQGTPWNSPGGAPQQGAPPPREQPQQGGGVPGYD